MTLRAFLSAAERRYWRSMLERHGERMSDVVERSGVNRTDCYRRWRRCGFRRPAAAAAPRPPRRGLGALLDVRRPLGD